MEIFLGCRLEANLSRCSTCEQYLWCKQILLEATHPKYAPVDAAVLCHGAIFNSEYFSIKSYSCQGKISGSLPVKHFVNLLTSG